MTALDLRDNKVRGVRAVQTLPLNLQALSLRGNGLADADAVLALSALTALDLSHNALTALPGAVADLLALQRLDLSHNALAALPPALFTLRELHTLRLRANRLAALPAAVAGLEALRDLDVASNRLARLPAAALARLPALRSLCLAGNPLQKPFIREGEEEEDEEHTLAWLRGVVEASAALPVVPGLCRVEDVAPARVGVRWACTVALAGPEGVPLVAGEHTVAVADTTHSTSDDGHWDAEDMLDGTVRLATTFARPGVHRLAITIDGAPLPTVLHVPVHPAIPLNQDENDEDEDKLPRLPGILGILSACAQESDHNSDYDECENEAIGSTGLRASLAASPPRINVLGGSGYERLAEALFFGMHIGTGLVAGSLARPVRLDFCPVHPARGAGAERVPLQCTVEPDSVLGDAVPGGLRRTTVAPAQLGAVLRSRNAATSEPIAVRVTADARDCVPARVVLAPADSASVDGAALALADAADDPRALTLYVTATAAPALLATDTRLACLRRTSSQVVVVAVHEHEGDHDDYEDEDCKGCKNNIGIPVFCVPLHKGARGGSSTEKEEKEGLGALARWVQRWLAGQRERRRVAVVQAGRRALAEAAERQAVRTGLVDVLTGDSGSRAAQLHAIVCSRCAARAVQVRALLQGTVAGAQRGGVTLAEEVSAVWNPSDAVLQACAEVPHAELRLGGGARVLRDVELFVALVEAHAMDVAPALALLHRLTCAAALAIVHAAEERANNEGFAEDGFVRAVLEEARVEDAVDCAYEDVLHTGIDRVFARWRAGAGEAGVAAGAERVVVARVREQYCASITRILAQHAPAVVGAHFAGLSDEQVSTLFNVGAVLARVEDEAARDRQRTERIARFLEHV